MDANILRLFYILDSSCLHTQHKNERLPFLLLLISTVEYYELVTLLYETNGDSDIARAMVESWQTFGGAVLKGQTSRRGFLVSDFLSVRHGHFVSFHTGAQSRRWCA